MLDYYNWPSEYENIVFVVYIADKGEIFDNIDEFTLEIFTGGTKYM